MRVIRIFIIFLCFIMCSLSLCAKNTERLVVLQNVSLSVSEGWTVQKTLEKNGDFILNCTKDNNIAFVEVVCKRKVMALDTRLNDIASERSMQKNFDYMQIDELLPIVFQKHKGKQLSYTNTYLNDVSKGGIYAFVFEGYTYSIEFYGEDTPEARKELKKVVNSFKIVSAEKTENMIEKQEEYQNKDWKKYTDTTSIETKVKEYGQDLLTINTADNHKKLEKHSSKEIKLIEQRENLLQRKETLQEELTIATESNDAKKEKKTKKELDNLEKQIKKVETKLEKIRTDNLKIKLKEKDK
ncbi:MAG: hypothetical protein Q4Q06_04015 [Bacteroidota bacterium]|nr:hypothetical protein [Bacteroidota bacterium]